MTKPILLFVLYLLCSCQVQHINQKKDKKMHGKWIEEYTLDTIRYQSIGRYKEGEPVKKWKYYANGKIIKKETYKKEYCKVRFYHPNGALQAKGITKLIEKGKDIHWFYSGQWEYFDTKKDLIITRLYDKGELISEKEIKNTKQ